MRSRRVPRCVAPDEVAGADRDAIAVDQKQLGMRVHPAHRDAALAAGFDETGSGQRVAVRGVMVQQQTDSHEAAG